MIKYPISLINYILEKYILSKKIKNKNEAKPKQKIIYGKNKMLYFIYMLLIV